MNNEHLSDEQLQEILDAHILHSGPILPLHLGTCASCQKRLDSFRHLYAGLSAEPGFALPANFADSVLDKIPAYRPPFWERPAAKIAAAFGAVAIILTGLLIFVNMRPLADGTLQTFNTIKTAFLPLGEQMKQIFSWMGGNAKPFLIGGVGLFAASLLDRLLRHQFLRHNH